MILDSETEALVKCTDLLRELPEESKVRVLKYLIDRFNLHQTNETPEVSEMKFLPHSHASDGVKKEKEQKSETPTANYGSTKVTKPKVAKVASLSFVTTLNLHPTNEKSLKDFFGQYVPPKDNFGRNLLICYYLERVIKQTGIGLNHIYTGYKNLGLKVPGNLYQSLIDTKNKKGWVDSSDMNDIKITVSGENIVEHDMPKAMAK